VNKSTSQQQKITNTLNELGIPSRLIMPTADVGVAWGNLLDGIAKVLDVKKAVDKASGELALAKTLKAEKEKKDRMARGEPDPEDVDGAGEDGGDADVKMEDADRGSAAPSARGGSAHKRSASVLSSVSDKSNKRQKK
jgi:DNA methyltransferase 1-associated protein 1